MYLTCALSETDSLMQSLVDPSVTLLEDPPDMNLIDCESATSCESHTRLHLVMPVIVWK